MILKTWIATEQAKHRLCACGCGTEIIIKRWHRSYGIPKYINGHILKSEETKAVRFAAQRKRIIKIMSDSYD